MPEVPTADGDFASRRDGSSCVEAARSREHHLFWSVVRSTTSFPGTLPPSDKTRRCSLGTASLRAFVMLASESSAPAPLASFHCAESRSLEVPRMLFSSSLAALAAVSAVHASPVVKRQGPGTGLPTNATRPDASSGNVTYTPVSSTEQVGSSYLNATVESVPLGVNNTGNWTVPYTNGSEPYPGAHIFIGELGALDKSEAWERRLTSARSSGNPITNGTNNSLAWPGQPAGGQLIYKPTYQVESNFGESQLISLATVCRGGRPDVRERLLPVSTPTWRLSQNLLTPEDFHRLPVA